MEVAATPSVFNTNSHTVIPRSEIAIKYLDHHIKSVFKTKDQMENPQNPNIALIVLPIDVARQVLLCLHAAYVLNASLLLLLSRSVKRGDAS